MSSNVSGANNWSSETVLGILNAFILLVCSVIERSRLFAPLVLIVMQKVTGHVPRPRDLTPLSPPSGRCNENAGHGQMMDVEASYSDFINCDRTGRRNAVPDITREGEQGPASTSELAQDMAEMDLKAAGQFRLKRPKC